jgi:hypothetical protein
MTWTNVVPSTVEAQVGDLDGFLPRDSEWRPALDRLSVPLGALRDRFGGDEGIVVDGFSAPHHVSIARWASSDPDTRLVVWFSFQQYDAPPVLRGTIYPPDILDRAFPSQR